MPERKVALIHTSPAALGPVAQFYGEAAPELELTNLLDDGQLRLLAAGERVTALRRLGEMIAAARDTHGAELALITCSSVTTEMAAELRARLGIPILKIDYPMARLAVRTGRRIGVAATFPPTLVPTGSLLLAAAAEAGAEIELVKEVVPEAYQALLAGDHGRHDELLLGAIERLEGQGADAIVLAQVSMARILPRLEGRARVPVFSSLHTSLDAIRAELAGRN